MENKKSRILELDALRGMAAMAVVLFHFTFGYDNSLGQLSADKFYFRYGYLGVHLFFLISGFVIFMTLEKTKKSLDFLVSRFSRLYPAYWAAIIITIIITSILSVPFQQGIYNFSQVLINFSMLQYFFKIKDVDGAYWTLAVELTFYFLMWGIFVFKKLPYIKLICLVWLFLSVIFARYNIIFENYIRVILILNYAPLFIGGISFYLILKSKNEYFYHAIAIISLFCNYYINYKLDVNFITYPIITMFYGLFYLFIYDKLSFLTNKAFLYLGTISYTLYLIHENIGNAIIYWLKKVLDIQIFYVPVTIGIVIGIASIITFTIEKPALKAIRNYYRNNYGQ